MTEEDKFFQQEEVKDVLISRAKNRKSSTCISGEDVDGVHYKYTREYLRWNLKRKWVEVTVHLTDDERLKWIEDNPAPINKFKQVGEQNEPEHVL